MERLWGATLPNPPGMVLGEIAAFWARHVVFGRLQPNAAKAEEQPCPISWGKRPRSAIRARADAAARWEEIIKPMMLLKRRKRGLLPKAQTLSHPSPTTSGRDERFFFHFYLGSNPPSSPFLPPAMGTRPRVGKSIPGDKKQPEKVGRGQAGGKEGVLPAGGEAAAAAPPCAAIKIQLLSERNALPAV